MLELLVKTHAFKVAKEDKPFWYTSGKIGPFYINTHFLFGGAETANALLADIDRLSDDRDKLIEMLEDRVAYQYENCEIYKKTMDSLVELIKENVDLDDIDYISGGERRDWFFSIIAAKLLGKDHIYLFKDNSSYPQVKGGKAIHIADLITEGSSYERSWIPTLNELGISMPYTAVVVNRKQAGEGLLKEKEVELLSLVSVDKNMFDGLLSMDLINKEQYDLLVAYMDNPDLAMKNFIDNNPSFLEEALKSDERTQSRARLCIEKGFYR